MHIVSAADDRFIPHYCVMLHSAWLHHPDARHHLLASGVTEGNLVLLRAFAAKRDISLEILECQPEWAAGLPVDPDFSDATWLRLRIPDLLPTVRRVIYLDADATVCGSLDALFATEMHGMPVAGMPDREWAAIAERAAHRLDEGCIYVNSGVMVLELEQWRRDGIGGKILSFARKTPARLTFMDQSALNVVLQMQIQAIDRKWNLFDVDDLCAVEDPRIIHYSGRTKPWQWRLSPCHDLYRFHRDHTPWPLDPVSFPLREWLDDQRKIVGAWLGVERHRPHARDLAKRRFIRRNVAAPALERARALLARTGISG